jgi:hypothetical protein
MTYFNEFGQARLGWNVGVPSGGITPSALWSSIYSVYNADSVGSSSLKTSLVSVYNGESNSNDSFGGNNGIERGGLTYTTGKIGNAFNLNGTTSYVDMGDVLDVGTSSWTYSMWFNVNNTASCVLFSKSIAAQGTGRIWATLSNNKIQFNFSTAPAFPADIYTESTTTINTNTWYHVVFILDRNDKLKMYINGSLETITTPGTVVSNNLIPFSSVNYNNNNPFRIGSYTAADNTTPSGLFNGKIDAFNIWNRVLTASEITELYNSGNGAQYITNDFYKPTTNDALNTNNGTAIGGLTYGVGKIGTAFQFNGTNAYVELPDNSFNFTNDFTASAWVYLQTLPSTVCGIVGNFNFAVGGWGMYLSGGNLISVIRNTAGIYYLGNTTSVFTAGQWTNVVMVFKKNVGFYIYGNGVLAGQSLASTNPNFGVSPIPHAKSRIGLLNYSGDWWWMPNNSRIDGVNVWSRALTTTEITELYNSGNGKQYPN